MRVNLNAILYISPTAVITRYPDNREKKKWVPAENQIQMTMTRV